MGSYFILGDSNGVCDVCGFDYKQSQLRKRWDGAMVCKHDWESRHPQDSLRPRAERSIVKDARPRTEPIFLEPNQVTPDDL